jgi:hypothetical protein
LLWSRSGAGTGTGAGAGTGIVTFSKVGTGTVKNCYGSATLVLKNVILTV